MANGLFDIYKENILGGGAHGATRIDLDTDTIVVSLIDVADDDPDLAVDEDRADLVAAALVGTAATLITPTVVNGTFDAVDTTQSAVSGDESEESLIYKSTGGASNDVLIVSFDAFGSGMPVTPNGGDIIHQWNGSGIFSL